MANELSEEDLKIDIFNNKIKHLKRIFTIKSYLIHIFIFLFHLFYFYFIMIIGTIFKDGFLYYFILIIAYTLLIISFSFLASFLRFISLKIEFKFLFYLSSKVDDLFELFNS